MKLEMFVEVFWSSEEAPKLLPVLRSYITCAGMRSAELLFSTLVPNPDFSVAKSNLVPAVVLTWPH
jgi:hypothetical protein